MSCWEYVERPSSGRLRPNTCCTVVRLWYPCRTFREWRPYHQNRFVCSRRASVAVIYRNTDEIIHPRLWADDVRMPTQTAGNWRWADVEVLLHRVEICEWICINVCIQSSVNNTNFHHLIAGPNRQLPAAHFDGHFVERHWWHGFVNHETIQQHRLIVCRTYEHVHADGHQ